MQTLNRKPDGKRQAGRFWQLFFHPAGGAEGRRDRQMTKQIAAIRNFSKEPKNADFGHLDRVVTVP